ncbi:ABC-type sugar transport system periplasmic component-like protein [Thermoclostridium stercorarium subsp. stercorarium DSM 8532]|uniref:ABC-type sugar transport system periplasmic component-like protein n=1 Tax=Thermoclostridium stercorarium (strain ATCC 35414 / DSM 8532 / NCIMB 11754) TaxID=1121335 RepID=L7VSX1_THES1|nr:ABC-type sugar transport system periplasmic component-like protein [Thermoclostridium stercorarium]AGC69481.1 ABC-type sugar transport system periplasmic component-like protein [Thermoclostridium stercorarium subsp. stercorarium DSM 8532]
MQTRIFGGRHKHNPFESPAEFATGTTDQVNAEISKGNHMVAWGYPSKIDSEMNRLSRNENPEASWTWAKVMPSSNPERATYFKRNPLYNADGIGFSEDASDEVTERFMDYMDWLHTEEGMVFRTYGIESVTYTKEGGNYVFTEQMSSPLKSEGKTLTNYGFVVFGRQHPNMNEYYYPYLAELEKTFLNREGYYYFNSPVMTYTDEESSELADITTSLNQTAQQYYAQFIMGYLDPENDKDWDSYIQTMKKLGLDRFCEIRTQVYERCNKK